jgi:DNA mismatch repair protein MutL
MGIIKLLPDHTANQIAAGEVVQRPASVVKELMENSVDSKATRIILTIKDGGKALIQVSDNGTGMNDLDARLCWERHATSKLSAIEDLFSLNTFGFRGEALASIAAVAQVDMKTRRAEEELGTHIFIEGSEVKKQEGIAVPPGTTITVRNLFFNVPARRSFLKSDPVETNHIIEEFIRVALANPDIGFVMTNNDTEVYHTIPGTLKQRILSLFGSKYNENLLPLNESTQISNIYGFVGKPEFAKKTRGEQYFFVNHRFIRNSYLNHAVVGAYQDLMPTDNFPFYVLFIDLDPASIDINVHPTKTEIKFREEKNLYTILKSVVKRSLGQHTLTPQFDFETPASIQNFNPSFFNRDEIPAPPQIKTDPDFNPFKSETYKPSHPAETYREQNNQRNWQELYEREPGYAEGPGLVTESRFSAAGNAEETKEPAKQLMQLNAQYILSPLKNGLMIIDQRAAHERILYERYLEFMEKHEGSSQRLLFPSIVKFSPADMALIQDLMPEFISLGFEIDDFGNNQVVINGVPTEAANANPQQLFEGMLENYKSSKTDVKLGRREGIAQSIAKKLAIGFSKRLNEDEMRNLVDELFACAMPYAAPDGRATLKTITLEDLARMFGS